MKTKTTLFFALVSATIISTYSTPVLAGNGKTLSLEEQVIYYGKKAQKAASPEKQKRNAEKYDQAKKSLKEKLDNARLKLLDPDLQKSISEGGDRHHLQPLVNAAADALVHRAGIFKIAAPETVKWEEVERWSTKFHETWDKHFLIEGEKVSSHGFLTYCALCILYLDQEHKINLLSLYQGLNASGNRNPTFEEVCDVVSEHKRELRINTTCRIAGVLRTKDQENRPQDAIRAVHDFLVAKKRDSLLFGKDPLFSAFDSGTRLQGDKEREIYHAFVKIWLNESLGEMREGYILRLMGEFEASRLSECRDIETIFNAMEKTLGRTLYSPEEIEMDNQFTKDVQKVLKENRSILDDETIKKLETESSPRHLVAAVIKAKLRMNPTLKSISWNEINDGIKQVNVCLPLWISTSKEFMIPVKSLNVFECLAYGQLTNMTQMSQTLREHMGIVCQYLFEKGNKTPTFEELKDRIDKLYQSSELVELKAKQSKV